MSKIDRGLEFSRYLSLELKGKITAHGYTAKHVADAIGSHGSTLSNWLNSKREVPVSVFLDVCEFIRVDPQKIVEDAYSRLVVTHGEADGEQYSPSAIREANDETAKLQAIKLPSGD